MKIRNVIIASLFIFLSIKNFAQNLFYDKIEVQKLLEEVWYTDDNGLLVNNTSRVNYNLIWTESDFLYVDTSYKSSVLNLTVYSTQSFIDELRKYKRKKITQTIIFAQYVCPDSLIINVELVRCNFRSFNNIHKGFFRRKRYLLQSMGGVTIIMLLDCDKKKWLIKNVFENY